MSERHPLEPAARRPAPLGDETPSGLAWRLGLAFGGAIFAVGLYGLLANAQQTKPGSVLRWVAGSLIAHDAILAPPCSSPASS